MAVGPRIEPGDQRVPEGTNAKWTRSPLHALKDRRGRDEADILVPSAQCDDGRAGAGSWGRAAAGVGGKSSWGSGRPAWESLQKKGPPSIPSRFTEPRQATVRAGSEKKTW